MEPGSSAWPDTYIVCDILVKSLHLPEPQVPHPTNQRVGVMRVGDFQLWNPVIAGCLGWHFPPGQTLS